MVAQGFMEPYSWDTTSSYSPVACLASIRTLLFMSGKPDDVISSVDVSTAFLQADEFGPGEPDRYVAYTPYKGATPVIKRLKGPVYGQRTAGTRWHETVASWLTDNGFAAGENEPCVFVRDGLVVVLYTDDVLCRGTHQKSADFYDAFTAKFHCANEPQYLTEEDPLDFVGFNITTKTVDGTARYWIDQEKALCQFLESIDMSSVRRVTCPMPDKWELVSDPTLLEPLDATAYRKMLGSISYFSTTTRYDIAHACSRLGQFNQAPTVGARKALYRVIGYLATTTDFKIGGKHATEDRVSFFCDSDLAGDRALTLRSQTGMVFY
jgi:hypothetical protein